MAERRLSAAEVRECYSLFGLGMDLKRVASERREAFDCWLAEHDREVAERAWEEGHEAGAMRVPEGIFSEVAARYPGNPYRVARGEADCG